MRGRPYRVDAHRHYFPPFLVEEAGRGPAIDGLRVVDGRVVHRQGYDYPLDAEFHDLEAVIASLDAGAVDHAVMSVTPSYWVFLWQEAACL